MTGAGRRRAHRAGLDAETIAVAWLVLKGWRVLARRYSASGGEIDVVARRGRTIAFVEVKWRADLDDAAMAIDARKRRRMARAARSFVSRIDPAAGYTFRADALYLAPWRRPRHVPGAFELAID